MFALRNMSVNGKFDPKICSIMDEWSAEVLTVQFIKQKFDYMVSY